jgi:hypothetical protein
MVMFKIPMRFKKQAGYMLLEAALALSVAGGVMAYYMAEEKNRFAEDMAKIHGQHMNTIAAGVNSYIVRNYGLLTSPPTPTITIPIPATGGSVGSPFAPTIQELMDMGLLPNTPGLANPVYGGGFRIRLILGSTTNPACGLGHVCGYVGTTDAVAPGGQVSSRTIGRALQEIGINGMATGLGGQGNDVLRSQNNLISETLNRAFGVGVVTPQQGLMAVRVGTEACGTGSGAACDVFLRRDGSQPMTGALNMGGKNIGNVANIGTNAAPAGTVFTTDLSAANTVFTTHLSIAGRVVTILDMGNNSITNADNITANGSISANGTTSTTGNITANRNITANTGNITASAGNISANGTTSTTGNITAANKMTTKDLEVTNSSIVKALQAQSISISGTSTLGTSCGSDHVSKDSTGNTLVCNGGVWKKAGANSVWLSGWHDTGLGNPWRQCPAGMVVTRVDANFAEKKLGVGCQYINVN